MHPSLITWAVLGLALATLFSVDLLVLRRRGAQSARTAGIATVVWTVVGLLATIPIAAVAGGTDGQHYITIYLLERALSLDNVAVFAIALAALKVAPERREGLVVAGVAAALVLRVTLIGGGLALVDALHDALYAFGALLVLTGLRTLRSGLPTGEAHPGEEPAGLLGRITNRLAGRSPTLLPLLVLAVADVVFAVDSIPAAFGISRDAFPIVAANGFAVLGLHAAYVLLETGLARFRHLDTGLGVVLLFIGVELLTEDVVHVPSWATLLVVVGVLAIAIGLSFRPPPSAGLHGKAGPPRSASEVLRGIAGWLRRPLRRLAVTVAGGALLFTGVALLVLPGPGVIVILGGLGLLATEYAWARNLLTRLRDKTLQAKTVATRRLRRSQSG